MDAISIVTVIIATITVIIIYYHYVILCNLELTSIGCGHCLNYLHDYMGCFVKFALVIVS